MLRTLAPGNVHASLQPVPSSCWAARRRGGAGTLKPEQARMRTAPGLCPQSFGRSHRRGTRVSACPRPSRLGGQQVWGRLCPVTRGLSHMPAMIVYLGAHISSFPLDQRQLGLQEASVHLTQGHSATRRVEGTHADPDQPLTHGFRTLDLGWSRPSLGGGEAA